MWLDTPRIAAQTEGAIWVEVEADWVAGDFVMIRKRDRNADPLLVGLALDLDQGMVYVHENGDWLAGPRGSSHGASVKLNRSYA